MSLADNKRSVFTSIGAYTSLMEGGNPPKQTDLFSSINNKNDIVPFLLDVLKTVAGTEALKEAIGGIFTKLVGDVEPKLKTELKKQFIQSNASEPLPTNFKNNGITVPVKSVDSTGKLKVAPDSPTGGLIYGSSTNFNKTAHNAILNSGTPQTYSNMSVTYISSSDSFKVKPNLGGGNPNIGEFFSTYIDDAQIIDKKEIVSNVMDSIYGTLSKEQDKTTEQEHGELETDLLLQQVLDGNDSFEISPNDYDDLLAKSRELVAGQLNYDMGCGLLAAELSFDDFASFVNNISGSTDPFYVGNQFESTISESTTGNTTTTEENKQTIKDGFFQKIIKVFTISLLAAVTTAPQIRVLFGMMSSLENNGVVSLSKPSDDMENFKTCIKCMAKQIMGLVAEFIFLLVVSYLVKLLKPVILKIIKEKINQYVGIIKSLTGANKLI